MQRIIVFLLSVGIINKKTKKVTLLLPLESHVDSEQHQHIGGDRWLEDTADRKARKNSLGALV